MPQKSWGNENPTMNLIEKVNKLVKESRVRQ